MNLTARRKLLSGLVVFLCGSAVAVALVPLFFVFAYVLQKGFSSRRPSSPAHGTRFRKRATT